VNITFEGRDWSFNEDEITIKQGIAIHMAYGFTVSTWMTALAELDSRAVQCALWLMWQQNGVVKPIADCDGGLVTFMQAYTAARTTEMEADAVQEAEATAAAAAVPVVPTAPVAAAAPQWPGPGYQTAMTPQPQPQPPEPLQRPATEY
jgi:hypothetical protein